MAITAVDYNTDFRSKKIQTDIIRLSKLLKPFVS